MNKKLIEKKKGLLKKFSKNMKTFVEFLESFDFLLPSGEQAKAEVEKEFRQSYDNAICSLRQIFNTQIEIIREE